MEEQEATNPQPFEITDLGESTFLFPLSECRISSLTIISSTICFVDLLVSQLDQNANQFEVGRVAFLSLLPSFPASFARD